MKKYKALLSSVLAIILLCSCIVLPANAQQTLPESEHRYKNDFYGEWDYTHSNKDAEGLFVTFSDNTYVEDGDDYYNIYFEGNEDITIEDVLEEGEQNKIGDIISIYDSKLNLVGVYQGDELSGQTVYVPDSSFKITLITDGSLTAYGFKVTNVTDELPEGATIFRYHMPDGSVKADIAYEYDSTLTVNEYLMHVISGDEAIIGWKLPSGEDWYYASDSVYDTYMEESGVYDFYAISTPVQLLPTDVYGFTNSSRYFTFDGDRYYMTKEHQLRLVSSTCLAGGTIPLALPAGILATVLSTYSTWDWNGACIGFANTVCLQKKGILDVVSTQPGATCVRDLKPTPELISLLNYYNAHSAATIVPKDKAFKPGSAEYTRQLKKLVKSALDGNLILFEFFPIEEELSNMFTVYHGIVITGAYEHPDGGYVLLYYDENDGSYARDGECNYLYVPADYSQIYGEYSNLMIFWTDSFEEFRSFDPDIENSNIFSFRIEFFKHLLELIREWFDYYIKALFVK
ncbi:MAG: hypothetical protein IKJ27_07460 [Clostridia bacterium]|nr:hypothetical protein [Clostridia bacterium]